MKISLLLEDTVLLPPLEEEDTRPDRFFLGAGEPCRKVGGGVPLPSVEDEEGEGLLWTESGGGLESRDLEEVVGLA